MDKINLPVLLKALSCGEMLGAPGRVRTCNLLIRRSVTHAAVCPGPETLDSTLADLSPLAVGATR